MEGIVKLIQEGILKWSVKWTLVIHNQLSLKCGAILNAIEWLKKRKHIA